MALIACDVDGVVADLNKEWLRQYNRDWNDNLRNEDVTAWDLHKFAKPECGVKIYSYIRTPLIYDKVKPYPGALAFINKLKESHKVFFVTAFVPEQKGIKYEWLLEHKFIEHLDEYVEARNKSLIRADWLIDDYYGNTKNFVGKTVLFARPWNIKYPERCLSYTEALSKITDVEFRKEYLGEKEVLWKK